MTSPTTCPHCGAPVPSGAAFCAACGGPIGQDAAPKVPAPAPEAVLVCPSCGKAASSPDQRFCADCGAVIAPIDLPAVTAPGPAVAVAAAAPAAAGTAPAAAAAASAPAGAAAKDGLAKLQSGFNDFMGSSIDTSQVGKGFDASSITLDGVDPSEMAAAFAAFGKSYSECAQPAFTPLPSAVEQRRQNEVRDAEVRQKEKRDFSATEGYVVYGSLASKLQPSVGPAARMVRAQHKDAAKQQRKMRLKHQVALGDIAQKEAVELAKD